MAKNNNERSCIKLHQRRMEDTTKKQKYAKSHWNETHTKTRMMKFLMQQWNFIKPLNIHVITKERWQNKFSSRVKVWERYYRFRKNKMKVTNFCFFNNKFEINFIFQKTKFQNQRNVWKLFNLSKMISIKEEVVNLPIEIKRSLNASSPLELSSKRFYIKKITCITTNF